MNKLEKIIQVGLVALALTGCPNSPSQPNETQSQPLKSSERTVTFSNGMKAYGTVEVLKSDKREMTVVNPIGSRDMLIYDEGSGNVYVTYDGKRLPNLTYGCCDGKECYVWEPYAFRECKEYWDFAKKIVSPE